MEWVQRGEGSKALLRRRSSGRSSGCRSSRRGATGSAWEHEFQQQNLEAIREHPIDAAPGHLTAGASARCRARTTTRRPACSTRAFNYPGIVAHVGALSLARRQRSGSSRDIKGPSIYTRDLARLRPGDRHRSSTRPTTTPSATSCARRRAPARARAAQKDARIGDLVFNRADRSLWGVRHLNGTARSSASPTPTTDVEARAHLAVRRRAVYDLDLSPDGKLLSASVGEINGRAALRVWRDGARWPRTTRRRSRVRLRQLDPHELRLLARRPLPLRQLVLHRRLEHLPLRARDAGEARGGDATRRRASSARCRSATTGSIVFRYTGEGFVPAEIEAEPLAGRQRDHASSAQQIVEKHPVVTSGRSARPPQIPSRPLVTAQGRRITRADPRARVGLPDRPGLQGLGRLGCRVNFSDPSQLNRAHLTASYSPDPDLPGSERGARRGRELATRLDGAARLATRPTSTTCSDRPRRSRKGYAFGLGYDRTLVYDEPRRLDLLGRRDLLRRPRHAARLPERHRAGLRRLFSVSARLRYTDLRRSLGHVDDEKGIDWELGLDRSTASSGEATAARLRRPRLRRRAAAAPLVAVAAQLGRLSPRRPRRALRELLLRRLRQQLGGPRRREALPRGVLLPRRRDQRGRARNYVRSMVGVEPAAPWRFRRAGTPGFYLTWAAPGAVRRRRWPRTRTTPPGAARSRTSARRSTCSFTVLSALDMTLSVGYARGVRGRRRAAGRGAWSRSRS